MNNRIYPKYLLLLYFLLIGLHINGQNNSQGLEIVIQTDSITDYSKFLYLHVEFINKSTDTLTLCANGEYLEIAKEVHDEPSMARIMKDSINIAPKSKVEIDYDITDPFYAIGEENTFQVKIYYIIDSEETDGAISYVDYTTAIESNTQIVSHIPWKDSTEYEAFKDAVLFEWVNQDNSKKVIKTYEKFMKKYPESKFILKVRDRLQLFYPMGSNIENLEYLLSNDNIPSQKRSLYEKYMKWHMEYLKNQ